MANKKNPAPVKLDFKARLTTAGPKGAWCHLHFPFDYMETFGTRARVPVSGTINGFPFRSSFAPMCGKYVLCVNREMQVGANAKPGDDAHFILQHDDQPRTVALPAALKKALVREPLAQAVFEKLSYSHRKEYVDWIAGAKQAETVQRRLEKLITMLLEKSLQLQK